MYKDSTVVHAYICTHLMMKTSSSHHHSSSESNRVFYYNNKMYGSDSIETLGLVCGCWCCGYIVLCYGDKYWENHSAETLGRCQVPSVLTYSLLRINKPCIEYDYSPVANKSVLGGMRGWVLWCVTNEWFNQHARLTGKQSFWLWLFGKSDVCFCSPSEGAHCWLMLNH